MRAAFVLSSWSDAEQENVEGKNVEGKLWRRVRVRFKALSLKKFRTLDTFLHLGKHNVSSPGISRSLRPADCRLLECQPYRPICAKPVAQ